MGSALASFVELQRGSATRVRFAPLTPVEHAPDADFDRFAEIAAEHFGVPIAMVSLIEKDRLRLKACIGMAIDDAPDELIFCEHALSDGPGTLMVVEDAVQDSRFAATPLVVGAPGVRFYSGTPLTAADGQPVGVLCIIDTKPRCRPGSADLRFLQTLGKLVVDQLELSRARAELEEQRRLMGIAEAMAGVGHWRFDVATQRVTGSDEVFRIFGLPVDTNVPDFSKIMSLYHEDDRAMLIKAIDRSIATGEGYEFTLRIQRPDGKTRHTLTKAECARDANGQVISIFGLFQDITDQHLAALALTESEHRYRLLASNVSDVISVYGVDGRFRYMSPSVEELLGYRPEDLVGHSPFEYILPEDHAHVAQAFAAHAVQGDRMTIEYRVRAKDGRVRWLEAKPRFHRNAEGHIIEISDSVRDVTERHEREAALRQARADAEAAARAKSTFLANMSHEIRTPMNGVIGFTDLLLAEPLTVTQREKVQMIADSGAAMMRLLNDILDLSKIEVGQMMIGCHALDIRQLLQNCATLMKPLVDQKGLTIMTAVADRVPQTILGDDLRLRQVILNLIGNAVKFTDEGAIMVAVSLGVDGDQDMIEVAVTDTGIGIARDHQQAIFAEFVQADETTARRYGGSGLGLAISAELVRLMAGTITLDSTPNVGTTVRFCIPLLIGRDADVPACSVPDAGASIARPSGANRLLVAEDHPVNQQLIRAMLAKLGIIPDIVVDGAAATQRVLAAAAAGAPYDLVLMDIQMPVCDGLEATCAIRANGIDAATLPIVALTANAYAADVDQCLAAGMQDHLPKPVTMASLSAIVARWTASHSDRASQPRAVSA